MIAVTASEAGSAAGPPTYATYPIMWVDAAVDVQLRLPLLPSQGVEGEGATVALARGEHARPVFEHLLHAP